MVQNRFGKEPHMAVAFDRKTYRTLLLFGFALFMQATAALSIVGALPSLQAEWGLTPERAAWLVTAFGLTFAASAPLLQMAVGHWPRRTQILIGHAGLAAGALAFAAAGSFAALMAARILMGLGAALLSPVLFAMATRLAGPRLQGPALALVSMGISIATVLGVPLSSWIGAFAGPRWLYALMAVLVAATGLAFGRVVGDRSPGERVSPREAAALLGRRATLSGLAVIFFLTSGVFSTFAMIAPILRDGYGFSPRAVSAGLLLFGLAGLAGNAVVRRASAVFRAETLLAGAGAILIALWAAWLVLPVSAPVLLAVLLAWPFVGDMVWPSQQRRMVELEPSFRGLVLAFSSSFMFTGMAFGSAAGGRAYAAGGRPAVLAASIGFASLALMALAYSRRAAGKAPGAAAGEAGPEGIAAPVAAAAKPSWAAPAGRAA
jgi:MFS transporter, DHA1 family, inner membrane transport protein